MANQNNSGWVRLHRKIEKNPLWTLEPFTKGQAWVDLFMIANHVDGTITVRGNIIPIKRGQLGWSEESLADRWKWSRGKVRRYLKYLETVQQITQQKSVVISIITVLKYEPYQSNSTTDDTTDSTTDGQQTVQQTDTNKNVKNVKNEKKYIATSQSSVAFSFQEKIKTMTTSNDERMKIIAFYWIKRNITFPSKESYETGLKRELRIAKSLKGYGSKRLEEVMEYLEQYADFKWTLESVGKYINEDLQKLLLKTKGEEALYQHLKNT